MGSSGGAMGTRTSTGNMTVGAVTVLPAPISGEMDGVEPGVEGSSAGVDDVDVRGLDVADADPDPDWSPCWLLSNMLTSVAVRAQHHASRLCIQCDSPSFQTISSSSACHRLRFLASCWPVNSAPTLSGESNLLTLPFEPDFECVVASDFWRSTSESSLLEYSLSLQSKGSKSSPIASPVPLLILSGLLVVWNLKPAIRASASSTSSFV